MAAAVAELPVDRWKPYLKFHTVSELAPYLSKEFVEARFDFYGRTLQGVKEMQPRWKRAVNNLDSTLGELLGKVYVEQHFKPDEKARMEHLVENLRAAFREGIDKLEWMGPETKKEAQAKLAAFRPKIGYPNKWRDYSKVEIRPDDLLGNMMRAWMADSIYQLGKAGKPIDPEDWGMTPQTVNAYYNPVRNEIVFPAAILQPPFFDPAADDAANYGGIGGVIGHEMGHGFDDQGRRYDAKGQLRDWWTAKDAEEFTKRAKGLAAQYSAMEALPGLKVNGELTLGENIGDLTGHHDLPSRVRVVARRQGTADDRRHHRIPALLLRLGAGVAGEVPRRRAAAAGAEQSARAGHDAGQRPAAERRRVLQHLRREGRRQALAAAGSTGQALVMSLSRLVRGSARREVLTRRAGRSPGERASRLPSIGRRRRLTPPSSMHSACSLGSPGTSFK